MRIAAKLAIGVLAAFGASALANFCIMNTHIKPHFEKIDDATSKADHSRVFQAIATLEGKLVSSVQDWAYWDDIKNYVLGVGVEEFTTTNLSSPAQTFDSIGIEYLSIRDLKGREVWTEAIALRSREPLPGLKKELQHLSFEPPFLKGVGEIQAHTGVLATASGIVLVTVAPIVASSRNGSAAGTLWMATRLDEKIVQQMTGVDFKLVPAPDRPVWRHRRAEQDGPDHPILTKSVLTDLKGLPSALLIVSTPRRVGALGSQAVYSALWLMALAAAAVIGTLWLLTHKLVVSKVIKLKDHFASVQNDGHLRGIAMPRSNDEIGQLASSFNGMADEVNHLRDSLADHQAYLSEVNEWAAGTLHNVRNSLSPINSLAWSLKSAIKDSWLLNLKTAIAELGAPDTEPGRREKLFQFLQSSAVLFADNAEQTRNAASEIETASKNIEAMVSHYERFTRHETADETFDVLELLREVSKSALKRQTSDVYVSFTGESTKMTGSKTVVRQILLNLFWNALDAMESQDGNKRIDCVIDAAPCGLVSMSIKDNGEGIEAGRLKTIFKRGSSTRKHRPGGLGLHWCANAANAAGGSLAVESQGAGHGATFVLRVPLRARTAKDAA